MTTFSQPCTVQQMEMFSSNSDPNIKTVKRTMIMTYAPTTPEETRLNSQWEVLASNTKPCVCAQLEMYQTLMRMQTVYAVWW